MAGRLVDLLINDLNRHYFDLMATFRFHRDYVNLLFLLYFLLCYIIFNLGQSPRLF